MWDWTDGSRRELTVRTIYHEVATLVGDRRNNWPRAPRQWTVHYICVKRDGGLGGRPDSLSPLIRLTKVHGYFSNGRIVPRLSLAVGGNRFLALLNPSNYNGAAILHLVTNLRAISSKHVVLSGRSVARIPTRGHCIGAIFRDCTLFPRVAIFRGITFKLHVRGAPTTRVAPHIVRTLQVIRLRAFTRHGPRRLSNNRRRHITVTHTIIGGPHLLLLSRSLSTLSCGLHGRVRGRLGTLRHGLNVAFIFIARSRRRTLAVSSEVIIVHRNHVRRSNAPHRVCRRPGGLFITNFVNRVGVFGTAIVRHLSRRHMHTGIRNHRYGVCIGFTIRPKRGLRILLHPRSLHIRRVGSSGRTRKLVNCIHRHGCGNVALRSIIRLRGNGVIVIDRFFGRSSPSFSRSLSRGVTVG